MLWRSLCLILLWKSGVFEWRRVGGETWFNKELAARLM